jgi:hypothetical protein
VRARPALAVAALLLGALASCGDGDSHQAEGDRAEAAEGTHGESVEGADRSVCRADAQAAPRASADLPSAWSFPPATTAYDVERREGVGTIVTAVTSTPFERVLDHLNHAEPGVRITGGETEDEDAEADWAAEGFTGRWAIRKSATCPGETVIQVLSTRR